MNSRFKLSLFSVSILLACYWPISAWSTEDQYAAFSNGMTRLYESFTNGMTRLQVEAICGQPHHATNFTSEIACCQYMFKTNAPEYFKGEFPSGITIYYREDIVYDKMPITTWMFFHVD